VNISELRDFARRYTAAWCSGDPARVAEHFSPHGSLTINDGAAAIGRKAITETAQSFMSAFPDLEVSMDGITLQSDAGQKSDGGQQNGGGESSGGGWRVAGQSGDQTEHRPARSDSRGVPLDAYRQEYRTRWHRTPSLRQRLRAVVHRRRRADCRIARPFR
jgi:SnoaL-like domain